MPARLKDVYTKEVRKKIQEQFGIKNAMAIPKVEKVVLNMGMGDAIQNSKVLDAAVDELGQITGQKPVVTKAKKSIASFKLREGMSIGTRVTLRGDKMYEFLDRLINIRGNYTLGIRDHLIFPEIDAGKVDKSKGMNITIVTTAKNDEQARFLLRELGMPFGK